MYLLTVIITEAFGLPKPSLFCNVQRDVASLPSYSKLNLKCDSWEVTWYLTSCLLVVINHAIQIATFWREDIFGVKCYLAWETCSAYAKAYAGCFPSTGREWLIRTRLIRSST